VSKLVPPLRPRPPSVGGFVVTAVHRCNACDAVLAGVVTEARGGFADVSNPNIGRCFFGTDGKWHAYGCPSTPWPLKKAEAHVTTRVPGAMIPPRKIRRAGKERPLFTFQINQDPTEPLVLQVWDKVNGSQGARFDGTPEGLREALALFRVPAALVESLVVEMWQTMTIEGVARAPREPS